MQGSYAAGLRPAPTKSHLDIYTGTVEVNVARTDRALARVASGQERDLQNSVEGGTASTRRRTN